jgi:hypothetical protein
MACNGTWDSSSKKRVIWQVGNGANLRVWRDPWIPQDTNRKAISRKLCCRFKCVADFLIADGTWNISYLLKPKTS